MKHLSKIFLVLLLGAAVPFTSCKKDEEDNTSQNQNNPDPLIGKWKLTACKVDGQAYELAANLGDSLLYVYANGTYREPNYVEITSSGIPTIVYEGGTWKKNSDATYVFLYINGTEKYTKGSARFTNDKKKLTFQYIYLSSNYEMQYDRK